MITTSHKTIIALATSGIFITGVGIGCAPSPAPPPAVTPAIVKKQGKTPRTHIGLNATLWSQTAEESQAGKLQAYRLAQIQLDIALKNKAWTASVEQASQPVNQWAKLPAAIILDIDETVLDNSPYQARLVKKGLDYDGMDWSQWVREAKATPINGALKFVQYARKKGVKVFYISNRTRLEEADTMKNLQSVGLLPHPSDDQVLSRFEKLSWQSDKASRRRYLAEKYRILLLAGDDFNDFVTGTKISRDSRRQLMTKYSSYWGAKWIMIPNPMYGSWEGALLDFNYEQPDEAKLQRKYEALQGRDGK